MNYINVMYNFAILKVNLTILLINYFFYGMYSQNQKFLRVNFKSTRILRVVSVKMFFIKNVNNIVNIDVEMPP